MIDQSKFGARGIINSSHFLTKMDEFRCWLSEVRGIPQDANVPKGELMEAFTDFCEEHNCCTFPHEKYYDLEAWDRKVAAGGGGKKLSASVASAASAGAMDMLAESAARQRAAKEEARKAEAARMGMFLSNMDAGRRAEILERQQLEQKMQYAFKSGQVGEAEKIKRRLEQIDKKAREEAAQKR